MSAEEVVAPRAWAGPAERVKPTVLKPDSQYAPDGASLEVGAGEFSAAVLSHIPDGALMFRLGSDVLGRLEGEPGSRRFRPLDPDSMRLLVDDSVRIVSTSLDKKGNVTETFRPCTRDLAGVVLAHVRGSPLVRSLRCVVPHPVYLPGFDLATEGYNAKGGVFYDRPASMPTTWAPADRPLDLLDDLFTDFPLKDDADRQNLYALMLTRILRPAIEGPTPFFFVTAPLEGTGKGMALDVASMAVTGERMPTMQVGGDEDEREKRITSLMLRGAQAVHFDNIPTGEDLDSAAIASLATAWPSWSGRILGVSSAPALPNNIVVAFSGNNPKVSGENARRSVPIELESRVPHPELRSDFTHTDPYAHALSERPAVLAAFVGMVEKWKAAGRPASPRRMGSFERWVESVVAVIHHAGGDKVLSNYEKWRSVSNDWGADAEVFIAEVFRLHKTEKITSTVAFQIAETMGAFGSYYGGRNDRGRLISFGKKVMTPLVDRPVQTGWLRRDGSGSTAEYFVQPRTP